MDCFFAVIVKCVLLKIFVLLYYYWDIYEHALTCMVVNKNDYYVCYL
jgi:hypothetical protein